MLAGERRESAEHGPPLDRIEAVGRLVEDHHLRIVDNGGGERHLLPHADRERLDRAITFLTGVAPIKHLVGAAERLGAGESGESRSILHHLHRGESGHGALVLGHHAHRLPHDPRSPCRIDSEHADIPRGQPHEAENRADERALARAIGPDEPRDPRMHVAGHALEYRPPAVTLDDAVDADRQFVVRGPRHGTYAMPPVDFRARAAVVCGTIASPQKGPHASRSFRPVLNSHVILQGGLCHGRQCTPPRCRPGHGPEDRPRSARDPRLVG